MRVYWTIYLTPALLHFPFWLTVCVLDSQVTRIEYVHSKSFMHKDISVDSFLVGLGKRAQPGTYNRLWVSEEIQEPQFLQGEEELDGERLVYQHQYLPRHQAESPRRHRITGLRTKVLPSGQSAVARSEDSHQEGKVR